MDLLMFHITTVKVYLNVSEVFNRVDADWHDDRKSFRPGEDIHHKLGDDGEAGAGAPECEPEVGVVRVADPLNLPPAVDLHTLLSDLGLPSISQDRPHHQDILSPPAEPGRGSQGIDPAAQEKPSDPDIKTLAMDQTVPGGRVEGEDAAPARPPAL